MPLDKFVTFYKDLTLQSVEKLEEVYHKNIRFDDPVGSHSGLDSVKVYFDNLLVNTISCRFDIDHIMEKDSEAVVVWTMYYRHPKLKNGQELWVDGTSHLKLLDDKVIYQRDYYDIGAMLYEHIPVIGRVIKWLKNGLKN